MVQATAFIVGRVKWFNNKTGFGFITVMTEGEHNDTDVLVHHSAIQVKTEQYKYLVQGEYVHFKLNHLEEGDHEYQASDVVGINGGMLMCETRNESRSSRLHDERREEMSGLTSGGQPSGEARRDYDDAVQPNSTVEEVVPHNEQWTNGGAPLVVNLPPRAPLDGDRQPRPF